VEMEGIVKLAKKIRMVCIDLKMPDRLFSARHFGILDSDNWRR